jgi:RNA polymerase sigma factor (sigma-70 family)
VDQVGACVTTADQPGHVPLDVGAVYRKHGRRCYALARRVVRDPQLARDVVQEVFAIMVRDPARFDPKRGTVETWLMTLTHHKSVDLIRSRRRRTGLDGTDFELARVADPSAGPADEASTSETGEEVRGALQRLGSAERDVIVLAYFGGFSQSEIARHLSMPLGTVKSRTRVGMRHLRENIASPAA